MLKELEKDFDGMTQAGHKIWYEWPERTPIDINDLKFAATNLCRYNGHLRWMLVRHLALCVELAKSKLSEDKSGSVEQAITLHGPEAHKLAWEICLLPQSSPLLQQYFTNLNSINIFLVAACGGHDLHETYVMDVPSGFKKYLPDYRRYEDNWENYVLHTFKINYKENLINQAFVKSIDFLALCLEMNYFSWADAPRQIEKLKRPLLQEEINIIDSIAKMSLDDCWTIVEEALNRNLNQQGNNGKTRN